MERASVVGVLVHGVFRGGLATAGAKLVCFKPLTAAVFSLSRKLTARITAVGLW